MLGVLFQITPLALENLVLGLRHVHIERREQPRKKTRAQQLQVLWVDGEILPAQRTNADELHVASYDIQEHRHLIEPVFTEELAYRRNALVVSEFAAFLKSLLLINVLLDILRIRVHRTELVDDEGKPFVPYALLTEDNGTVTERQYQRECKNEGGKDYQAQKGEHYIKQTLNQMLETAHRITMFHVAGLTVTVYTVVQHLSFYFY